MDLTVRASLALTLALARTPSTSDMAPHLVAITRDLFTFVHLRTPHQYWHLVATEVCTVGKRVIRFLLECLLLASACE